MEAPRVSGLPGDDIPMIGPWIRQTMTVSSSLSARLIQAIKIYRETTGAGLKEAKDAVDAIAGRGRR
jgi:hypothetical protein